MARFLLLAFAICFFAVTAGATKPRQPVNALYIPLADHYAALVAYEKYRHQFQYADFTLEQMPNWDLLRAKFLNKGDDMAFVMSPLAMDMFAQKPIFRWIGLMHRDGNGLAVNEPLASQLVASASQSERKPHSSQALALKSSGFEQQPLIVGVPHLLSTHAVILYQFLSQYDISLSTDFNKAGDIRLLAIAPPKSPAFLLGKHHINQHAAIEQSLPWIDLVETRNDGKVLWYSKDVLPTEKGHVECIALASDKALNSKGEAIAEVFTAIQQAGEFIEQARNQGGEPMEELIAIIQKHIPGHSREAIIRSLDPNLKIINYQHLEIDKPGLAQIMEIAVKGNILNASINLDEFAYPLTKTSDSAKE